MHYCKTVQVGIMQKNHLLYSFYHKVSIHMEIKICKEYKQWDDDECKSDYNFLTKYKETYFLISIISVLCSSKFSFY